MRYYLSISISLSLALSFPLAPYSWWPQGEKVKERDSWENERQRKDENETHKSV